MRYLPEVAGSVFIASMIAMALIPLAITLAGGWPWVRRHPFQTLFLAALALPFLIKGGTKQPHPPAHKITTNIVFRAWQGQAPDKRIHPFDVPIREVYRDE